MTEPVTTHLRAPGRHINPEEDGFREAVEAGITTVMSTRVAPISWEAAPCPKPAADSSTSGCCENAGIKAARANLVYSSEESAQHPHGQRRPAAEAGGSRELHGQSSGRGRLRLPRT